MSGRTWTLEQLHSEIDRYERSIREADITEESVESYVSRANRFVSFLAGDWKPQHTQFEHPHRRRQQLRTLVERGMKSVLDTFLR
jgi:hypothetical protein